LAGAGEWRCVAVIALVAFARVQDLLAYAKHLFVVANCAPGKFDGPLAWPQEPANGER
jgi:hypothetical protein